MSLVSCCGQFTENSRYRRRWYIDYDNDNRFADNDNMSGMETRGLRGIRNLSSVTPRMRGHRCGSTGVEEDVRPEK
ncbi:MAG: hypothetical protein R6U13_03680 [Desulfatiglandaceae bacterium]